MKFMFDQESEEIERQVNENIIPNDTDILERKKKQSVTKNTIECFLSLLGNNYTIKDMAPVLNLSIVTIRRMYKRYISGDYVNLTTFKTAGQKKSDTKKDLSHEKNIIAAELALNPCTTLKAMSEKLLIHNHVGDYSTSTVSRIIKDMGYSRKALTLIPINKNSNEKKNVRAQYGASLSHISDNQLIFLDETGFNLHTYQNFGTLQKNTKCYINVPNGKGTNIYVLCAITNQGILAFKIKVGSFKSVDIVDFIETQLSMLIQNERKYIVMDNASIHKTAAVKKSIARRNYILKFIPPYSPQLNPIEKFFSAFKSRVKQQNTSSNSEEHIGTINCVLLRGEFRLEGYYNHMRIWIEKAAARIDFI
ncbi:Transposable element Tc3 transposase [Dictyocoela muelleri]|nr:Transposable element Tc3 transposase [Dictyocoela muelleri]